MQDLVSVIIPTYKRPDGLERAIKSVMAQTYGNIEIIVVDDNDADSNARTATSEIMYQYKNDPRIHYELHPHNKGGAEARNTGLKHAKGSYIAFLDNDDEFLPDKLSKEVGVLKESKATIGFVMSEMVYYYENGTKKTTNRACLFDKRVPQLKAHLLKYAGNGFVGTPTFLFKKSVLDSVGGFYPISIRQEYCLLLKILGQEFEGIYINAVTVKVNVSTDSVTRQYSLQKEKDIKSIYNRQREVWDILDFRERMRLKYNHLKDLLIFLYLSKNYRRFAVNALNFFALFK